MRSFVGQVRAPPPRPRPRPAPVPGGGGPPGATRAAADAGGWCPALGQVVSNRMQKTAVVMVERLFKHPRYEKIVKARKKFYAHDAEDACAVGDKVKIRMSRPLSKTKKWVVTDVLHKAKVLGGGAP